MMPKSKIIKIVVFSFCFFGYICPVRADKYYSYNEPSTDFYYTIDTANRTRKQFQDVYLEFVEIDHSSGTYKKIGEIKNFTTQTDYVYYDDDMTLLKSVAAQDRIYYKEGKQWDVVRSDVNSEKIYLRGHTWIDGRASSSSERTVAEYDVQAGTFGISESQSEASDSLEFRNNITSYDPIPGANTSTTVLEASVNSNDTDIASNASSITTNSSAISSNDTDISTNASAISSNDTDISANASAISSNDTDIASNAHR